MGLLVLITFAGLLVGCLILLVLLDLLAAVERLQAESAQSRISRLRDQTIEAMFAAEADERRR